MGRTIVLVVALWLCLATAGLCGVNVQTAEGVMTAAELGMDSCRIVVGGTPFTSGSGDFEGESAADRAALAAALKKAPGRHWPTLGDLNARVQVYYVRLHGGNVLLKYRVVSRPPHTWFVIVASETSQQRAYEHHRRAREGGFMADVVRSEDYPGLKPGYFVVVAGAFMDSAAAASTVQRARTAGWPGAYVKQAR